MATRRWLIGACRFAIIQDMEPSRNDIAPFGQRLESLLVGLEPPRNQAWLATQTGLTRSTISRLVRGLRNPTLSTAQCLAPVLGVEVSDLLAGTDAEDRLADANRLVRREDYDAVVKTLIEYERRVSEAGALARSLGESLAEAERRRLRAEHQRDELVARCDRLRADHERAQNGSRQAEKLAADRDDDLRRHRLALHKAVAEISTLRSQVSDLSKAVDQTKQSARVGQILAGIGAVTGVITVASFLGGGADDDDWDSDDE